MNDSKYTTATIELVGANCTSCSIAIEHMGEKLPGVRDIWVDKEHSRVYVDYTGDQEVLDAICTFVHTIGYQANVLQV